MAGEGQQIDFEQAARVLEVSPSASAEEIRSAYLRKVQQHPPDRDAEVFEKIRDAYEQMRNPAIRARAVLGGLSPEMPLERLLDNVKSKREFVGSQLWLEVLKEKRT